MTSIAEQLAALPEMPVLTNGDMPLASFLSFPMDPRFRAMCQREIETNSAIRARLALACALLEEAIEDIEGWGDYAGEYFQKKHGLHKTLEEYRAAIPRLKEGL